MEYRKAGIFKEQGCNGDGKNTTYEAGPKTRPAFHLFINTTRRFNNRRL